MTPDTARTAAAAEHPTRPRLTGPALRLTVLIGEQDTWHHRPLYSEIVHRAHTAGLAGASVFRGIEGFGASSIVHTSRLLSLSEELPVAVVVVDTEERVRAFLPELADLVPDGLVTLDACEVVAPAAPTGTHEEGKRTS
ncbi:DUF190 domain-containing protein [Streptomyces sp. MA5143a]|uniref:DUF190 domain-containing protein n=1 Tax=Streptomyces sp. MA5143a TaxID=2083010 RepID=UPI000D19F4A5|nr:DUF190 domain-containing protein [Streptomyces sp. MA5143a]SPF07305.1 hypothetical protein SMA5143A_8156 [Streptomyces sp. MA5143a]